MLLEQQVVFHLHMSIPEEAQTVADALAKKKKSPIQQMKPRLATESDC